MKMRFRIFLTVVVLLLSGGLSAQTLIMNEVSNGPSGNQEYVEFVVYDTAVVYDCNGGPPPCIDIRGWIFDDNSGYHNSVGVAPGCVRFAYNALWSCVPVGTIITIYNDADPNTTVTALGTDVSLTDGNCRLTIPISSTLFESNPTTPGAVACSYPVTGWVAGGNWSYTLLANTGDCARIVDVSGCEVFSVCWGTANANNLIYFSGNGQDDVWSFTNNTNNNPFLQANWTQACAGDISACGSNDQTPGYGNNSSNATWIGSMNNNCTAITPLSASNGSSANSSCGCTGTASANASGSIGPYTFQWSPAPGSGQGTANVTGLCAGTYTCVVTSAIHCSDTLYYTITSPASFSVNTSGTNITCSGGNNGTASATPTGGTAPFSYSWFPSGGTTANATGLSSGTYTVTVTDATLCSSTATITLTQPSAVTANITPVTNVSCFGGNNGSATVTPNGGTPGYTYSWAPSGGTGTTASGLTAAIYTVTVTDNAGCTQTATTSVTQPAVVTAIITSSSGVTCFGGANGSAIVTGGGGTVPYTYSWSPSGGSGNSASGLGAGVYTVTITDNNGCTATTTTNITAPTQLTASVPAVTNPSCGAGNGSATASASGGTGPYTYTWSPSGGSSITATGLSAGTYTVTVTDNHLCTATATVTLVSPSSPSANITSSTDVSCFGGNNGSATVTVTGGSPGYTYSWSPSGGTSTTASGLTASIYTVTATDNAGCTATASVTITAPLQLQASITASSGTSCFGGTDGSAVVSASGGTAAYSYNWSPSGGTGTTATGLGQGIYTVAVTDQRNCTATTTVSITSPALLTATITSTSDVLCNGGNTGSATVSAGGGTTGYTYAWLPSGGSGTNAGSLSAGIYTATVTDANGCTASNTATINEPSPVNLTITSVTDVSCYGGNDGAVSVNVTGGTAGYTYLWSPSGTGSTATSLTAGVYTVTVTDAGNCTVSGTATINQPGPFSVYLTATDSSLCNGDQAQMNVGINGGQPAYTYSWSAGLPPNAVNTVTPAVTTTYTVTVTDNNGCTAPATLTILVEPAPVIVLNANNPVCEGGVLNMSATGGTVYAWTGPSGFVSGQSAFQITPVTVNDGGVYTVTVSGALGCTASSSVTVTVEALPVVNFSGNPLTGCAPVCVQFTDMSIPQGSAIVSWVWTDNGQVFSGQQNPNQCFNLPGTHTIALEVTTATGCTASLPVNNYVNVNAQPQAAFFVNEQVLSQSDPELVCTDASVFATGWSWNFGDGSTSNQQNPSYTYTDTGTYCIELVVTSQQGCEDSVEHCIRVIPEYHLYIPNAFTPNDDDLNDTWFPVGPGLNTKDLYIEVHIFNRWGERLYRSTTSDKPWNGRYNNIGEMCPEGVYVYRIIYVTPNAIDERYMGHINLIR